MEDAPDSSRFTGCCPSIVELYISQLYFVLIRHLKCLKIISDSEFRPRLSPNIVHG